MKVSQALQWAEALESGKYEQGRMHLYNNGLYCCLGVYSEINNIRINDVLMYAHDKHDYYSLGERSHFICLNDGEKLNFQEIASFIRSKCEGKGDDEEVQFVKAFVE